MSVGRVLPMPQQAAVRRTGRLGIGCDAVALAGDGQRWLCFDTVARWAGQMGNVGFPCPCREPVMMSDAAGQKSRVRQQFNLASADYDSGPGCFAHYGRRLVDAINPSPGTSVLDIACGRGAILFPAAAAVGNEGAVVGIDLADGMIQQTREDARARGIKVRLEVGDAENLNFADESLDYVLCGFGIMFFPNQSRALDEFRRVLKPGGRLGVTTWRVPQIHEVRQVLTELGVNPPPYAPGWITEPAVLSDLLVKCGFHDVQVILDDAEFEYPNAEAYWEHARGTGFRQVMDGLDTDVVRRGKALLRDRFGISRASGMINVTMTALIGLATR